ncbi:MAG: hypothetical protein A3G76_05845 [Acidobacteria bacterium RIFCSPLOWO2_12_FULL_65_11]|nr:MAG: hypothetical protein A3H95_13375 [Acidobacteria bacterium RIFCSPLOWO2_02_FULL_64_15]OFW31229.1 MAG: hypothetical protein A3G76_05845 [Acidobacteria bacterium RIFCSPLOWO2_12_FULL_65_11]
MTCHTKNWSTLASFSAQNQIDPRPRHEHRQPSQKVEGIPLQVRRAIGPPMPQLQDDKKH